MNTNELRIMFAENEPLPFEEKTVRGFRFEDISKSKIRAFTKEADINIGRIAVPDFLRSLNAADGTQVKNAGVLFFARDVYKYFHHVEITLLAFKGTDRLHIYDRRDIRDDLLTQFNEAVAFLKKHLNIRSEIRGVNRKDIYEIPMEALREAVVNALMHRDYNIKGTQISVEVYDDRVEIINPGGLPKGLSLKKFGSVSIRRNEVVADLFSRMNKVERLGSGIRKMQKAMSDAGLQEPEFEPNGFFTVVFRRSPEFALKGLHQDTIQKTAQKTTQKTVQKIIALIGQKPDVTRKELAKAIGITDSGVKYHLKKMQEQGILRRVGPPRGGHWEIVD